MKNNDTEMILDFIKGAFSIFKGLSTVLWQAGGKRVTQLYPEKKPEIPDKFRGAVEYNPEMCTGCGICVKLCPTLNVLKMDKETKKLVNIDISRCIFCGNCAYNCPKGAINMTKQYELAVKDKNDLLLNYAQKPQLEAKNGKKEE